MKSADWIAVSTQMPQPATEAEDESLLLWVAGAGGDCAYACVGSFDGKDFWTHDDFWYRVDPTHWQTVIAP